MAFGSMGESSSNRMAKGIHSHETKKPTLGETISSFDTPLCDKSEEEQLSKNEISMNRRNFLRVATGVSLGIAAASSIPNAKEKLSDNPNAPFSFVDRDKNGIDNFKHSLGMEISIMYQNHNEVIDPKLFPEGITDVSYDNGGRGRALGCEHIGYFFSEYAPPHYKSLGQYIIDHNISLHLICPASPFAANEDNYIPLGIDYGIAASQCGLGALLTRDAVRELLKDMKYRRTDTLHKKETKDLIEWDLFKVGAGAILMEPLASVLPRLLHLGIFDGVSEKWLQSTFARNPQLLPMMNRYIDLLHTIKLRQLMADRTITNQGEKQHFQLVIGKTHVGVATGLEKTMEDLFSELDDSVMQMIISRIGSFNSLTIPTSICSQYDRMPNKVNKTGWEIREKKQEIFYPEIFNRMPVTLRKGLLNTYPPNSFSEHRFVGTQSNHSPDINLLTSQ